MPKDFDIEIKDNPPIAPYLKVYMKGNADHTDAASHIEKLDSVRRANVTTQQSGKKDLTIYPPKAYDITETQHKVRITLDNYFKGNTVDPQFIEEPVSAISEKAYYQVIDYIQMLGRNLEAFKWLNEKFDEERFRDYFLPFLNTISKKHCDWRIFSPPGQIEYSVYE